MDESVKLDVDTYKNIIKMLKLGGEDMELAVKCVENMETSNIMLKLLQKPINPIARKLIMKKPYKKGHLGFIFTDLTLDQIEVDICKSLVQSEKDIFNYLKITIYENSRSSI